MKIVYTLSGGAAYGYAHVGVLQFLEESGLRPDAVVGTSMGAIVGGLYARGYSAEEIREISENVRTVELMRLFFPSFPRGGIIDTDGIRDFFHEYVGDARIEELPMLYRSVAVDIDTGEEIVFDRGRLIDAMIASMSIPAVFKPYRYEGRYLVDGGVVNNLPWDIARQYGRNHVIVNVAPQRENPRRRLYTSLMEESEKGSIERESWAPQGVAAAAETSPQAPPAPAAVADEGLEGGTGGNGGTGGAREGFRPLHRLRERFGNVEGFSLQYLMHSFAHSSEAKEKVLGLPEVITNVMAIVNEEMPLPRSRRGWTYAYLHPELSGYSLNDFQKAGEIIDLGYRAAAESPSFVRETRTIVRKKRRS